MHTTGAGFFVLLVACSTAPAPRLPEAARAAPSAPPGPAAAVAPTNPEQPGVKTPAPAAPEQRRSWFGVSFDLGDDLLDESSYRFKSQGAIEKLVFTRSGLRAEQVPDWVSSTRARLGGAFGARVSDAENLENPSVSAIGAHVRIAQGSLWYVYLLLDAGVLELTVKCRSDCEREVRRIVESIGPGDASTSLALRGQGGRYRVLGVAFDSSQPLEEPNAFYVSLAEQPPLITCRHTAEPPPPGTWPPLGGDGEEALQAAPTIHEVAGADLPFRLSYRRAEGVDYAQQAQAFLAAGAVAVLGNGFLVCELNAHAKPGALDRFRRFLDSARRELVGGTIRPPTPLRNAK